MKIAHISDVHIRNLKFHAEYKRVFEDLYRRLDQVKPDIIINTGDTAHTKTQISPEFVEMCSEHLRRASEYAPYHMILGNHDMNLMNLDRQDAITPIVESIGSNRIFLHKKSGLVWSSEYDAGRINLWTFSLADQGNYPVRSQWEKHNSEINIGLFHGSVRTCLTDSNWRMTNTEHDISIFDGLDYALLGDIHKQQFFNNRKIAYAGSLIQQNFGEEIDKGFLVWNIRGKDDHTIESITLNGSRKFYTVRLNNDLQLPDVQIDEGSRIRISPSRELTLVQQHEIEKEVKKRYKPHDVVTLSAANIGVQQASVGKKSIGFENLRQAAVQERLIRDYLKHKELDNKIIDRILELNGRYQISLEQNDELTRDIAWKINKIVWSNLFNYGENNVLDFSALGGLTGIFAPNSSGKSNFIDVLLETCFDNTTKGISKNIFLVNDNKDSASAVVELTANDQRYVIERTIERIKYGHKKSDQTKEWGKTTCNFYMVDEFGSREPLVGTLRPETERNIRQRLGSFDDFMLTSLSAQWNALDIIACKETDRKKILYKFLDLDIFEQKCLLAKDESKEYIKQLRELEEHGLDEHASNYTKLIKDRQDKISELCERITTKKLEISNIDDEISLLISQKKNIDVNINIGHAKTVIDTANDQIIILNEKIGVLRTRLIETENDIAKLKQLEQKFDADLYEKKTFELSIIEDNLTHAQNNITKNMQAIDSHKKNISLLRDIPCGDQYPQCKFLIGAYDSKATLPILKKDVDELEKTHKLLDENKKELYSFREKLELYRKFIGEKESLITLRDNINLQLENYILRINNFEVDKENAINTLLKHECAIADVKHNDKIISSISVIKILKGTLGLDIKCIQDESTELTRLMGADQGVLEKISAQLEQLQDVRDYCTAYEHYMDAMGKDGIAYQILAQKLPLVNDEINKILTNIVDFNVIIEHDNDEQSIRLYLQYENGKRRLIELGGGAEKMLSSVAIRTALLSISNLPKTNMFIIDEGFGKLDPKNFESINRMFDYLKSVFEHVIVISHIDIMKDMVDNTIDITTDEEGYAHVEIGG